MRKNILREEKFVLAHGLKEFHKRLLESCLWVRFKADHPGEVSEWQKLFILWQTRSTELDYREKLGKTELPKTRSQWSTFSSQAPTHKISKQSQNSTIAQTPKDHVNLWEAFPIQTITQGKCINNFVSINAMKYYSALKVDELSRHASKR